MYHNFLIHLSADGHLGCLHFLAVVNSAVMNFGVHVSLSILVSSVCMPSSGIAWLYGSSSSSFWYWTVQFSHSGVSDPLQSHGLQHARTPYPSPNLRVCLKSCPSCRWCHSTISSSATPFSSCLQSFPASGSFPISQFFPSGGHSIGPSASALEASVLPMNIQDWFPLGWTGLISLLSKGLSRVFSNTKVQKHQFFVTQLSL